MYQVRQCQTKSRAVLTSSTAHAGWWLSSEIAVQVPLRIDVHCRWSSPRRSSFVLPTLLPDGRTEGQTALADRLSDSFTLWGFARVDTVNKHRGCTFFGVHVVMLLVSLSLQTKYALIDEADIGIVEQHAVEVSAVKSVFFSFSLCLSICPFPTIIHTQTVRAYVCLHLFIFLIALQFYRFLSLFLCWT